MAKAFPLLIAGGAALLLMKKKKPRVLSKVADDSKALPDSPHAPPRDIEDVEDMDDSSTPVPQPGPTPTPDPMPDLEPEPGPTPTPDPMPEPESSKPPIGPSGVGTCVNSVYTRDPVYITGDITVAPKGFTEFTEAEYYFYIRRDFQTKLYNYMLQRFTAMKNGSERRTVASVVLREGLKHFNSGCAWQGPTDLLGAPEQLVWSGGRRLAIIAQITAGVTDPSFSNLFRTGQRFSIPRTALGEPDVGFFTAQTKPVPGTRVEILVTDSTQENAEHIIGEIAKLSGPNGEPDQFEIKVVQAFQGSDVAPRLRTKHGFKVGSNAYFSQKGPTGIYRIFPKGMV